MLGERHTDAAQFLQYDLADLAPADCAGDRTGDDFVRAEGRGDRGLVVNTVGKAQERR